MFDLDVWQEIAATARRNTLRTALTASGVFWGMFMLMMMLGFGDGLERGVTRSMGDFATNSVYIWAQRTSMPYQGMQPGRWIGYDNGDAEALRTQVEGAAIVAPRNQLGGWRDGSNVRRLDRTGNFQVMGDYPAFRHIQPMVFDRGRFINPLDIDGERKVAVIGSQVHAEMFDRGEDPIGQHVEIQGVWFQVVGLFHSAQTGDDSDRLNGTIFVPFTTFQRAFNYGDRVGWFAITGRPEVPASLIEERVRAVLSARHRIHPEDHMAIGSWNAEEEFSKISTLFAGIRMFTWVVGTLTLLTGVVGVGNIMLIAVRERTPEIGLRRALGATPGSIVRLIVQEALVLTAVAGYAGLVFGVAVLEAVARAVGPDHEVLGNTQIDFGVALLAAAVLIVCGAVAGLIPARHAARIHPVDALRSE